MRRPPENKRRAPHKKKRSAVPDYNAALGARAAVDVDYLVCCCIF